MSSAAPIHPGIHLKREIERLNLNKSKTAKALQIGRMTLFRVMRGEADITVDLSLKLEKSFRIPASLWLSQQADFDRWKYEESGSLDEIPVLVTDEQQLPMFL